MRRAGVAQRDRRVSGDGKTPGPASRTISRAAALTTLLCLLCWVLIVRGEIYRWTDAEGRTHFGDRPPVELREQAQDLSASLEGHVPFRFEIIPVEYAMPTETHAKVEVAVAKIHHIYRSRLGLRFRTDPSFNIRIFSDQDAFSRYGDGPALKGLASGYFSPARNEAVTWRQRSFAQMLEVITHEANHALLHHAFGPVPPWLNEGLSEYFERMEVFGQAVVIHPNPHWDALIKAKLRDGSITSLADYLGLGQRDWQVHDLSGNRAYAQAWSVVYFLMSSPKGTRLLTRILDELGAHGASDFAPAEVIESGYHGGLPALETAWRAWAMAPKEAHYY
jgi:hypothetical protein